MSHMTLRTIVEDLQVLEELLLVGQICGNPQSSLAMALISLYLTAFMNECSKVQVSLKAAAIVYIYKENQKKIML